ncbi:MAG: ABC transporter permease [Gammaproteobacteria bacterium]|nr:MAG: ABC transporter permease [Gammaproteobacteria bacterium]
MLREHWIALRTLALKEFLRFIRIWVQTVLPPVVTTALYFIIFGALIGRRLGPVGGHPYMVWLVPGLVMLAVVTNAYANVVSSFFSAKFHRHIEELLVAPVPNALVLAGYVAGGVARGLVVGLAVLGTAAVFAELHFAHPGVALAVWLLTSVLFSLAGLINGIYARTFDDISIVPTFVLTPLTYLGGIFYSIDMLPPFWKTLSLGNPLLYIINSFRYGMLGVSDVSLGIGFGVIGAFILVLAAWALWLLGHSSALRH